MRPKSWPEFYAREHNVPSMLRWATTHSRMFTELLQSETVLEVGTGTGMLSALLSRYCRRVVSLDSSAEVLDSARRTGAHIHAATHLLRADAFAMPFAGGAFQAVFSQGLFEHFSDDDIRRLLGEQLRVAEHAYVSVPTIYYPHLWRIGPGLVGNERLKTLAFWRRLLSDFDFKVEEAAYYSDFKLFTFAGATLPWPSQALLKLAA